MRPHLAGPSAPDDLSTYLHRQCIGFLGLQLPLLVWLLAGLRPADAAPRPWSILDSISVYYYTSGVIAISGVLAALAVFFLTYRGYDNAHGALDRVVGWIAGVSAITVAVFPTPAVQGQLPGWWKPWIGAVHYAAATVLFLCFMVFSLLLFTRSNQEVPSAGKRRRNVLHVLCGIVIGAALLWIVMFHAHHGIFVPETLALLFFAASWLTKGRADHTVTLVATRTVQYARHPRRLACAMGHHARAVLRPGSGSRSRSEGPRRRAA